MKLGNLCKEEAIRARQVIESVKSTVESVTDDGISLTEYEPTPNLVPIIPEYAQLSSDFYTEFGYTEERLENITARKSIEIQSYVNYMEGRRLEMYITGVFNLESTSAGRAFIVFGEASNFYTSVVTSSMVLGRITGNAPTFTSILADCGEEVVAESVTEIVYGVTGERNILTEFASGMFVSGLRGKASSGMKNIDGIDGSYVRQKIDVDNFDVPTGSNVTQGINPDVDLQYHSSYDNIDDVDVSNELYNVDDSNAIDSIDVEEVVQESVEGGSVTNGYSGEEWCRYFRETYGNDNVTWENATPSQLARSWQGSGKYPGIDEYTDITVNKGTILYRGEPNGTEYFTSLDAIEQSRRDATTIFEGLQVEKNPIHGYRGEMQGYLFNEDVASAYGITNANPQYGKGGLPQYYVPDVQDLIDKGILIPVDNIKLNK